jgi:hypothetical protein
MKRWILSGLCLSFLLGCPSTQITKEQQQDVRAFRRGSEQERLEIAKKYDAEEEFKKWEAQIETKEIAEGMPRGAVLMSWGNPKFTEVSKDGRTEKWFYRWIYDESYTLYFKDGKLESWSKRKYQRSTGR